MVTQRNFFVDAPVWQIQWSSPLHHLVYDTVPLSGVLSNVADEVESRLLITGSTCFERFIVETDLLSGSKTNGNIANWQHFNIMYSCKGKLIGAFCVNLLCRRSECSTPVRLDINKNTISREDRNWITTKLLNGRNLASQLFSPPSLN